IKTGHFGDKDISVEDIYKEVFSLEASQMEVLKADIRQKFELAEKTFARYEDKNRAGSAASQRAADEKDSNAAAASKRAEHSAMSKAAVKAPGSVGSKDEALERLRLFSFACELGFDIYLKQLMLENICDRLSSASK
ncbi:MAG TPA: hypothetical protein IAB10_05195, partial [Candidatus Avilachnospira avistercoris]|nr:hypothetical protein [Candidatus Avilachnospira avistercoris]